MEKPDMKKIRFAALAADIVLFRIHDDSLQALFMDVDRPPHFENVPAMPGGLLKPEETAKEAAVRILKDKGGVESKDVYMEQLYTFSKVDRDPRGRVVSVAYLALMDGNGESTTPAGAFWQDIADTKNLAYDHDEMLGVAIDRLRARIEYTNIIQFLLPKSFTLTELQKCYETVLGHMLDKRNFRKKVLGIKLVKPTGKKQANESHRPAELYTFSSRKVQIINVL